MPQHQYFARSHTGRIAAAVVAIVLTGCGARVAPSGEAGYPPYLINTPVCAVDDFDDGGDCAAFGWAEGRVYRPVP